jgi:hypothetical protein
MNPTELNALSSIHKVRLPRRRSPASYSGQFWTLNAILGMWWRRSALCLYGIGRSGPKGERNSTLPWTMCTNATDYGKRTLVEPTMGRYKALIGPWLRARGFAAQQTEAAIGVAVLNQMLAAGRPDSVRRARVIV